MSIRRAMPICIAGWLAIAAPAWADVVVTGARAELPRPGRDYVRVFMTIRSDRDLTLENAASPAAGIVQIQRPVRDGAVEAMRSIDDLAVPAGKEVELLPGGRQVALFELKRALRPGQKLPLTLTFVDAANRRTRIEVLAEVIKAR